MIWLWFAAAILAVALILYMPGFFLLRAFGQSSINAFVFAPPLVLALYAIIEIVLSGLGIRGSWCTIFLPVLVIAVVVFLLPLLLKRKKEERTSYSLSYLSNTRAYWGMLALYVAVGAVVTSVIFCLHMHRPDSYTQLYDNAWHMGIIQKFLINGDFSTVKAGDIVATSGSTFYPTGWHSLVALAASLTGEAVPISINASIVVILGLVYPISMFALMSRISENNRNFIIAGAFTVPMFAAFPWRFLTFGPLYSNLLSFSIVPLVIILALNMVEAKRVLKERLFTILVFVWSIVGVAATQPNAVFTIGVLVVPYLFLQIPAYLTYFKVMKNRKVIGSIVGVALAVAIAGFWALLYNAKFMQRTVTWQWPSFEGKTQALIDVAFVGFHDAEPQILLGILIFVGVVYTVFHKRMLWMTSAYLIMCVFYAISSSTEGFLKNVLTGFWYHDQYRLGASAVFYGAVLAGIGLWNVLAVVVEVVPETLIGVKNAKNQCLLSMICILLIVLVNFFPSFHLSGKGDYVTPFGAITRDISYWNSSDQPKSYSAAESAFVAKVKKIVPEGEVVLNQPYDGSAYAWGQDSLNVYYKAWEGNWMGSPTEDNCQISKSLDKIAESNKVRRAVQRIGAEYLLILDRSDFSNVKDNDDLVQSIYASYSKHNWEGIDNITDKTKGFTVVLSQGDMRLYKIAI